MYNFKFEITKAESICFRMLTNLHEKPIWGNWGNLLKLLSEKVADNLQEFEKNPIGNAQMVLRVIFRF